jgi:hypothetical protein
METKEQKENDYRKFRLMREIYASGSIQLNCEIDNALIAFLRYLSEYNEYFDKKGRYYFEITLKEKELIKWK